MVNSLYIVAKGCPLFYEDPPYIAYFPTPHLILNFATTTSPLPCHVQPLFPTVLSVVLFLWLNGWSRHIWCAILLNDSMDLHMSSYGTIVSEGPWCVFCAIRHQVYWSLTHNVVFYWFSDLISHTQKYREHTQGPVDWHTHIHIYLHHLLCAYSSYLY